MHRQSCFAVLRRLFCLIFLYSLLSGSLTAQPFGSWRTYTSLQSATAVALESNSIIWVGTTGGLYRFDRQSQAVRTYTNTDGLPETRITALLYDAARRGLWIGYEGGSLSFFDTGSGAVSNFLEIARITQFSAKAIRDFYVSGDSLYIATDYGISLYTPSRREIKESYTALGAFAGGTRINAVLQTSANLIAATPQGIAVASRTSPNLAAPTTWRTLALQNCNALAEFNNQLYIAANDGLYLAGNLTAAPTATRLVDAGQKRIVSLAVSGNTLFALAADEVIAVSTAGISRSAGQFAQPAKLAIDNGGNALIADGAKSLLEQFGTTFTAFAPNTPVSNGFAVVATDEQGRVWASSSASDGGAAGFYRLTNGRWENFVNIASPPVNQFSGLVSVDGNVYLSTWGRGLIRFSPEDSVSAFNRSNSDFVGIRGATDFVVLSGATADANGQLWIANFQTTADPIYKFNPATDSISKYGSLGRNGTQFPAGIEAFKVAIDNFGGKWITCKISNLTAAGAVLFNDNGTPEPQDDFWFRLTDADGAGKLPNLEVNDIQVDRDGSVWFATALGAGYYFDPTVVADNVLNGFAPPDVATVFLLRNENLTSLAIDALNRKWFGSTNGVWLTNADGTEVLAHYTTENSPLVSNAILSVAYDRKTGRLYFGTDRGLSALTTTAVEPKAALSTLKIYPNPYRIPSTSRVVIEGLTANASLKILTVAGTLVRSLTTQGGSVAEWDGKDDQGRDVASGIYIAAVVSADKKNSSVGKIAVIRRQ